METEFEYLPHCISSDCFYRQQKSTDSKVKVDYGSYALVSLDFDNFNYINDLFSYEFGDRVLRRITEHFSSYLVEGEQFSRLHADHFAFFVKASDDIINRFCEMTDVKELLADILPTHYNLVCSGGIVFLSEYDETLSALLDKANFARKLAKGNHVNTFFTYDKKVSEDLEWRKVITLMMESALKNNEFEMYLQPKVLIKTGQIVGAEALARWNTKDYGMIFPDRFIPILEQNGFIKQLDFFMLDQACLFLEQSIVKGIAPLPISVNFSKIHIRTSGFVDHVFHTVNRHGIPTKLIEIEFTENIYLGDFQTLVEVTSALKYLGFRVSLDDFGSAYSSLNYLKDLPVDIIKIDKGFLNSSTNTDKGRVIISKVVEMAKSLRLLSVMEGVETEEQVDFLQKLSCDLGQGFFYAKPMPVSAYTDYVKNGSPVTDINEYLSSKDSRDDKDYLNAIPQEFQMDNWELYTLGQNIDMGLMKGYLDGEASIQYINNRALEYLGYNRQEFREIFNNNITAFTHPDDVLTVKKNSQELISSGKPLEFRTRAIRKDGKIIVFQGRASCVIDNQGRHVGIYAFQDVTKELERTEALQQALEDKISALEALVASERKSREALCLSQERYRLTLEQGDDIMFDWDFADDSVRFSGKYSRLLGNETVQKNVRSNPAILDNIHPEDVPRFKQWVNDTYKKAGESHIKYRFQLAGGQYIWVRARCVSINDAQGKPIEAVGALTNIDSRVKK
ncbi:MAG: EAL domain-containing protein [Oscillospiraceae bacterium]